MSYSEQALRDAARALCEAGRELYGRGGSPATSSNYSLRLGENACAVTVSGRHKGRLTEEDIMAVDLSGRPLVDKKPSAEMLLHTQLYRWSPEVGAVLHTHSPAVTTLTMLQPERASIRLAGYELLKAFAGIQTHETHLDIPVFPNTQDIAQLAEDVDAFLAREGDCRAYAIRGHGVYTWGRTLDDCMRHLEALEFMLGCELEFLRITGVSA